MVCNAHSACETALHIYKCNFIPLLTSDLRHSGLLALSLCYSQYLYRRLTAFSVLVPQLLMHTGTCCAGGSNTEALADGPATTSNGNASSHAASHVLCISPYPHYRKDRADQPVPVLARALQRRQVQPGAGPRQGCTACQSQRHSLIQGATSLYTYSVYNICAASSELGLPDQARAWCPFRPLQA